MPGDCHSCCNYPGTDSSLLGFTMNSGQNVKVAEKINLRCNSHGFNSGWFYWPSNFDPAWLTNCDGYTKVEDNVVNLV